MHPTPEAQIENFRSAVWPQRAKTQKEEKTFWQERVKRSWAERPRLTYKWLRGTTKVWNLAVSLDGVWGATLGEEADLEKNIWEKLWVTGPPPTPPPVAVQGPAGLEPMTADSFAGHLNEKGPSKTRFLVRMGWPLLWTVWGIFLGWSKAAVGGPPFCPSFSACKPPRKEREMLDKGRRLRCSRSFTGSGRPAGKMVRREEKTSIFLDCSKRYERVPLTHLHQVLLEAGLPHALVGPAPLTVLMFIWRAFWVSQAREWSNTTNMLMAWFWWRLVGGWSPTFASPLQVRESLPMVVSGLSLTPRRPWW